jgi:hypothetical protein
MHNTKRDNKKIACVTMVRDEDTFLKIWYRYYSGLFGAENCFVIDHNSSTKKPRQILGNEQLSVITIPHESAINAKEGDVYAFDRERFKFISEFIKMLRLYYDIVIFNDADELFLPDPRKYTDLAQYLDKAPQDTVIAGVGIEVYHNLLNKEPAYNFEEKLFKQRANFVYRLHHSKPYIISTDCQIGGHGSTRPVLLDPDLILVHLKYLDASIMRERQALLYSLWQAKKVSDKTRWRFTENEIIDRLDNFAFALGLIRE